MIFSLRGVEGDIKARKHLWDRRRRAPSPPNDHFTETEEGKIGPMAERRAGEREGRKGGERWEGEWEGQEDGTDGNGTFALMRGVRCRCHPSGAERKRALTPTHQPGICFFPSFRKDGLEGRTRGSGEGRPVRGQGWSGSGPHNLLNYIKWGIDFLVFR